ncbi:Uncharacterized protein AB751O23_AK_00250 [Chlamydiales bacterium SCGC AB-751-O23]|jgi:queuosine precursor transporter|nr:Uncharacterized protein AB751O23_AK_00250 [Chlamydiales bacterium SCGC AB-751-O23]
MSKLFQEKHDSLYVIIIAIFCTLIVATNEIGTKIFSIPLSDIALPCGIITYPAVFAITDIVSEVWGPKKAKLMVILGFFASVLNLIIIQICVYLPPHSNWVTPDNPFAYQSPSDYQTAFLSVFSQNHMMILASMLAYLAGQMTDIKLFHYLKVLCNNKHLWIRNNLSTFTAQLIDTIIFSTIFFYLALGMEISTVIQMAAHYYGFKLMIAILDTPFVYLGVYGIKQLKQKKSA